YLEGVVVQAAVSVVLVEQTPKRSISVIFYKADYWRKMMPMTVTLLVSFRLERCLDQVAPGWHFMRVQFMPTTSILLVVWHLVKPTLRRFGMQNLIIIITWLPSAAVLGPSPIAKCRLVVA